MDGRMEDKIKKVIADIVTKSSQPLETKEIHENLERAVGKVSRSKLLYRLNDLRGEGEIHGKNIGSGKGVWIWWKKQK